MFVVCSRLRLFQEVGGGFPLAIVASRLQWTWVVSRNPVMVLLGEPIVDRWKEGSRRFIPTNGGDVRSFGAVADDVH